MTNYLKIFLIIIIYTYPSISFAQVVINEIAWMGTNDSANSEWIELYNLNVDSINLSGWTLEAQDGTPKINLSGIILGKSYFLLERTSDGSVLGVTADIIYGGALSNDGEILILKNESGNEINKIDASNGWLAGDNKTKETMQWAGLNWITASPTPGVANAIFGNSSNSTNFFENSNDSDQNEESLTNVSTQNAKLEISAGSDRATSPGSPIWFQATLKKNTTGVSSELSWSFGDGNVGVGSLVSHTYKYPGDYVVVLSANAGDIFSVSRLKVKVVESSILVKDGGDYLEISNNSNTEVNLFNWKIENKGKGFVFQPNTIILPRSSMKLDKNLLMMKGYDNSQDLCLKNSLGQKVFVFVPDQNMENVRQETSVAQIQLPQFPKPKTEIISENSSEIATGTENIIYEAPKADGFISRLTNFIKRVFSN